MRASIDCNAARKPLASPRRATRSSGRWCGGLPAWPSTGPTSTPSTWPFAERSRRHLDAVLSDPTL